MIREDTRWEAVARSKFEEWVTSPPYEMYAYRHDEHSTWPGNYKRADVDLAWQAWREAVRQILRIEE